MTDTPSWFADEQLSRARQRMAQTHAVLTRVLDELPPKDVTPPALTTVGPTAERLKRARREAYPSERAFVEKFSELAATGDADA